MNQMKILVATLAVIVVASGCAVATTMQCEFACEKTPTGFVAVRRNCAYDERHGFTVFASRCAENNGPRYR